MEINRENSNYDVLLLPRHGVSLKAIIVCYKKRQVNSLHDDIKTFFLKETQRMIQFVHVTTHFFLRGRENGVLDYLHINK